MSDELHKYPGNLKRHKVEPLFTDEHLQRHGPHYVIGMLQAARAKDAELIQQLVDVLSTETGIELPEAQAAGFKPSEQ